MAVLSKNDTKYRHAIQKSKQFKTYEFLLECPILVFLDNNKLQIIQRTESKTVDTQAGTTNSTLNRF